MKVQLDPALVAEFSSFWGFTLILPCLLDCLIAWLDIWWDLGICLNPYLPKPLGLHTIMILKFFSEPPSSCNFIYDHQSLIPLLFHQLTIDALPVVRNWIWSDTFLQTPCCALFQQCFSDIRSSSHGVSPV